MTDLPIILGAEVDRASVASRILSAGEIAWTTQSLFVGDGNTLGGIPIGQVPPELFGAVSRNPNNTASVATNNVQAFQNAINSGFLVDLGGRSYEVDGSINAGGNGGGIKNGLIIQKSTVLNIRTMIFNMKSGFLVENIKIDESIRDRTQGSINDAISVNFYTCSDFKVSGLKIVNGGRMSGISFDSSKNFVARDIGGSGFAWTGSATDDVVQVVVVQSCDRFLIDGLSVHDNSGGSDARPGSPQRPFAYIRGIAMGGCTNMTVANGRVSEVDEAYDLTGSNYSEACIFIGCQATDCGTWGFKAANLQQRVSYVGCTATRCGQAGFVCASNGSDGRTQGITYDACTAYDCGTVVSGSSRTSPWSAYTVCGFRVLAGSGGGAGLFDYPRRVLFRNCGAEDRQSTPTMKYGAFSDALATPGQLNELFYFRSYGEIIAPDAGFGFNSCVLTSSSVVSILNHSFTAIAWNNTVFDGARMFASSNPTRVTVSRAGPYRISLNVDFQTNATGTRFIAIYKNGSAITRSIALSQPVGTGDETAFFTQADDLANVGDYYEAYVYQASGSSLNVNGTKSGFSIVLQSGH